MAEGYSARGLITRVLILLILIGVLIAGALLIFDRLGIIQLDGSLARVSQRIGLSSTGSNNSVTDPSLIEKDRLDKNVETLNNREFELQQREDNIREQETKLLQWQQRLEEQEKLLTEKEDNLTKAVQAYDDKNTNLLQQAGYLSNMPPDQAIQILLGMNDQDMIDVLRATERYATINGSASLVSVWLQMIAALPDKVVNGVPVTPSNADRVATIMRKMTLKSSDIVEE